MLVDAGRNHVHRLAVSGRVVQRKQSVWRWVEAVRAAALKSLASSIAARSPVSTLSLSEELHCAYAFESTRP